MTLLTISFSDYPLGISEKSLKFSITVAETTENFRDFSLIIVSGFSVNEILGKESLKISGS